MEQLTHQQIQTVIDWMETWEQLKDTAIPLRFKEDFTAQIPESKKPPIGIMPKWIWEQHRKKELMAAISRYVSAGMIVPVEWVTEFNSLS